MYLNRDLKFLSKRKTVEVEIPELECKVILRELSFIELRKIGQNGTTDNDDQTTLLAMMIVDQNGNRVYTTEEDLKNLAEMPFRIWLKLVQAANELNTQSAQAQEEILKN